MKTKPAFRASASRNKYYTKPYVDSIHKSFNTVCKYFMQPNEDVDINLINNYVIEVGFEAGTEIINIFILPISSEPIG